MKRLQEVSKVRGTAVVVERSKNRWNMFYRTKHWNTSEVEQKEAIPKNSLTPWRTVLIEKTRIRNLFRKLPEIYGNDRPITAYARAHYLFQSWAKWIQSKASLLISFIYIFISSPHLRLDPSSSSSSTCFPKSNHTRFIRWVSNKFICMWLATLNSFY